MTTHPITTDRATRTGPLPGAALAVAVTGPLAVAALRMVMPYDTVDDGATIAAKVAAHPGGQAAVIALTWVALLTLPLGLVLTSRAAVRARPMLGAVAAVVAWLGFMSVFTANGGLDAIALAGARAGVPAPVVAALSAALDADPVTAVATTVFVAGHILGAVLLGVALWNAVPRWAALALAVSQPLHLVFAVVVPNHALDGLAWSLTAVGFGAAALAGSRGAR